MFSKKTIRDIDLDGKKVLIRTDYNVPVKEDGTITDDYRIEQSLPTLQYLIEHDCRIVICSHLGRPTGPGDIACSLRPVAHRLSELLQREVQFVNDCVGPEVEQAVRGLAGGQLVLLENVRFHPEEEKNDKHFAQQLAESTGAEVFVQDCFGVAHRAHASIVAITEFLPGVAGLLLEREVDTITGVMEQPKRPLVAIIGGAKIADKIDVLNRLIDLADIVAVGGAMANTFLQAEGVSVGKSLSEAADLPLAKEIMERARAKSADQPFVFYLPGDGVVAESVDHPSSTRLVEWNNHSITAVENYPKQPPNDSSQVKDSEMILDIGPFSAAFIAGSLQLASTVIWNGTMGVTETSAPSGPIGPFARGTEVVAEAILGDFGHKPFSLVGGGDTVGYVEQRGLTKLFNHVSTGGGASLELMSGRKLPGVEVLQDK